MVRIPINYLSILLILVFAGCNNKTEFFELSNLKFEMSAKETGNGQQITEYVIISNPPKNLDSLTFLIKKYNDTTLDYCKTQKATVYRRFFYKETRYTPRDYKEDHSFISDIIVDHLDDLIATVEYDKKDQWVFKVKTNNNPDKWKDVQIEPNCE